MVNKWKYRLSNREKYFVPCSYYYFYVYFGKQSGRLEYLFCLPAWICSPSSSFCNSYALFLYLRSVSGRVDLECGLFICR